MNEGGLHSGAGQMHFSSSCEYDKGKQTKCKEPPKVRRNKVNLNSGRSPMQLYLYVYIFC